MTKFNIDFKRIGKTVGIVAVGALLAGVPLSVSNSNLNDANAGLTADKNSLIEDKLVLISDVNEQKGIVIGKDVVITELQSKVDKLQADRDSVVLLMAQESQDEVITKLSIDELKSQNDDVQSFINSNFNKSIVDEDDVSVTIENVKLDALDREDSDFDVEIKFLADYFENGDEDLSGKAHLIANVEVRDGEIVGSVVLSRNPDYV